MKIPEEKNDPVWKLLENASSTDPSPFFARNVTREVRNIDSQNEIFDRIAQLFRVKFAAPIAALGLIMVGAVISFSVVNDSTDSSLANAGIISGTSDFSTDLAEIEYRSQLMAVADPGRLSDESLIDLFF